MELGDGTDTPLARLPREIAFEEVWRCSVAVATPFSAAGGSVETAVY